MGDDRSMTRGPEPVPPSGSAVEAFAHLAARVAAMEERLDGRMAVMARALEHISAERQTVEIPDYGNTLAKIAKSLAAIEGKPAMQMTPEDMAARMEAAAELARRDDRATLVEARKLQADGAKDLARMIGTVATISEQKRRVFWVGGMGIVLGFLLGAVTPGFVAHLAPTDWHWSERIAARAVRERTLWDAGMHLMRVDDPAAWETLVRAAELWRDNRDAIASCKSRANRSRTAQCVVQIKG